MPERDGLERGGERYLLSRLLLTALFGAVLFASAGRLDWGRAWLYLALVLVGEGLSAAVLTVVSPAVLNRRGTLTQPDTKRFDRVFMGLWVVLSLATGVVGGFDAGRFARSSMPMPLVYLGAGLTVTGYAIGTWAMAVNDFFEPSVRIQREREQTPATTGPYRFVRHPGYLGAILGSLGAPFFLGSSWMLVPVVLVVVLFTVRTALEDRVLQRELAGYREYARRTPHRLLPGVW
jgi:protein-S-isoprenylcysteine O-methyltransferase Ste14